MDIIRRKYTKKRLEAAREAGRQAATLGLHKMHNPHGIGTMDLFCHWSDGYEEIKNGH